MTFQNDADFPYYIVRTIKRWDTNPSRTWSNTYEIVAPFNLDFDNARTILNAIVAGERIFHGARVEFTRAIMSTFQQDTNPYNATEFVTAIYPDGTVGQRTNLEYIDLRFTLQVRRNVESGRPGKLAFRGCIGEADVAAGNSGEYVLSNATSIQTLVSGAFNAIELDLGIQNAEFVMLGRNTQGQLHVRTVDTHTVVGISTTQLTRGSGRTTNTP